MPLTPDERKKKIAEKVKENRDEMDRDRKKAEKEGADKKPLPASIRKKNGKWQPVPVPPRRKKSPRFKESEGDPDRVDGPPPKGKNTDEPQKVKITREDVINRKVGGKLPFPGADRPRPTPLIGGPRPMANMDPEQLKKMIIMMKMRMGR